MNLEAERLVLGCAQQSQRWLTAMLTRLRANDFALEKHRRIYGAMERLSQRGSKVDRVTIANELMDFNELEACDGLSYLIDLDTMLPDAANLDAYVEIVSEKARLRRLIFASENIQKRILALDGATSEDISRAGQAAIMQAAVGSSRSQLETLKDFIQGYPGEINALLQPWKYDKGLPSGFAKLDEITDGFHKSEIFLVSARPSHGKSALALDIALNVAKRKSAVAVFSLEMDKKTCFYRLACNEAQVAYIRFRNGDISAEERSRIMAATQMLADLPIAIDDEPGLTIPVMAVKLQAIMNKLPLALWVLDYAQLVRLDSKRGMSENEKYTEIAGQLQELERRIEVPLLLLSQLNRESEKAQDKRPRLSQSRGSGTWEQIAQVGALLWREEMVQRDRADLRGKAELIVEKNRGGIPNQTVMLGYQGWRYHFQDPE